MRLHGSANQANANRSSAADPFCPLNAGCRVSPTAAGGTSLFDLRWLAPLRREGDCPMITVVGHSTLSVQ